jgi:SAM-dependent methyltransferase
LPRGIDFSAKMVAIAKEMFPGIEFVEGDAQDLPASDTFYDRVLINFGLLHLSHPEKACAEAFRVLKSGGRFGFTVWAEPGKNPGGKIMNDAVETHADSNLELPAGPPYYPSTEKDESRKVLQQAGFDGGSMIFETHLVDWRVPTAEYFFEVERDAGVRTAGLLARQTPETLKAIQSEVEQAVQPYRKGDGFAIPMAAHLIVVSKP